MKNCVDFPSVGQFLAILKFNRSEPCFESSDEIVDSFSHGAVKMFRLIDRMDTGFASRCAEGVGEHTHELFSRRSGCGRAGLSLSRKLVYLLLHPLDSFHHVGWGRRLVSGCSGCSTIGGTWGIDVGHADRSFRGVFWSCSRRLSSLPTVVLVLGHGGNQEGVAATSSLVGGAGARDCFYNSRVIITPFIRHSA